MKCTFCKIVETTKATLILDKGAKWRVRYCPACECVQRIGDSVPDIGDKAKVRYFIKPESTMKGGDKH